MQASIRHAIGLRCCQVDGGSDYSRASLGSVGLEANRASHFDAIDGEPGRVLVLYQTGELHTSRALAKSRSLDRRQYGCLRTARSATTRQACCNRLGIKACIGPNPSIFVCAVGSDDAVPLATRFPQFAQS